MTLRRRLSMLAAAVVAAAAVGTGLGVYADRGRPGVAAGFIVGSLLTGLCLSLVGTLLFGWRPDNRLGPLLFVMGASVVAEFLLRQYAFSGLRTHPGTLALPDVAGWAGLAIDALFFPVPLALTLLLFPDGRLPGPRWRPVAWGGVALVTATLAVRALRPGPLRDESYGYAIPWRGALPPWVGALDGPLTTAGLLLVLAAAVSLVGRYVRADRALRRRLEPLAAVAALAALALLLQVAPATTAAGRWLFVAAVAVALPAALASGALLNRVWDLDLLLVATIIYGGLALLIGGGFVATVVAVATLTGAAEPSALLPSIAATAVVAVAFAPVKDRLSRGARRLVLGVRATPYDALVALPRQLADLPAAADVVPRTADALARGLGVTAARVRAAMPGSGEVVGWSGTPPADADPPELVVVEVRHLGQRVGDVAALPSPDRPLGRRDRRLLDDLAAQAGPALRGVALAAESAARLDLITAQAHALRASRHRLATAQVAERQRLERDIHDGAQQKLVALAVRVAAAEALLAGGPAAAREAVAGCRADLQDCIDELRQLARGIFPPVLAARGLVPALRARARVIGGVRVVGRPGADLRLPLDVEVAAYFCCLEALQNAAKHAPGAPVTVTVEVTDGTLVFAVADEGPGFDPAAATAACGIGLTGMVDRVAAVDGTLTLDAAPGQGCRVTGRIPIGSADGTQETVVSSAGRPGAGTIVAGARSGEPG